jgi:hypothetical protein
MTVAGQHETPVKLWANSAKETLMDYSPRLIPTAQMSTLDSECGATWAPFIADRMEEGYRPACNGRAAQAFWHERSFTRRCTRRFNMTARPSPR